MWHFLLFHRLRNCFFCGKIPLVNEQNLRIVEVVAAVIYDDEGRVLATRCAPHKHNGGWEFPGGKIEHGESPEAAVVREISEELNVRVRVGKLLHTVEWDYPTFHLRMYCYACSMQNGTLQLREHTAYRWLGAADINSVDWLPADVDVLPHLFR